MRNLLHLQKPHRVFAALVVLCYLLLSVVIPFQHKDCLFEAFYLVASSTATAKADIPLKTQIVSPAKMAPSLHCSACEWQSVQVSPALSVLKVTFVPPPAPRIITTFPRYLPLTAHFTSSRAPPLA